MSSRIIILSDGDIWESLEGDLKPQIWEITDRAFELLESGELAA